MVVSSGAAILNGWNIQIILSDMIKNQAFESMIMLACGMVTAALYGFFNRYFKVYISRKLVAGICEVIFWFFAGALTSEFLYYCTFGQLSPHVICAFLCGVFLWKTIFYATIPMGEDKCLNKRKKEAASSKTQKK